MEKKNVKNKVLKFILWFLSSLIFLLLVIFLLVRIPSVQNYITKKITESISQKTGTRVEVASVYISFPYDITVRGIFLDDLSKDTLVYADEVKLRLDLFALIRSRAEVDKISLTNGYVNLYRARNDTSFNFDFLARAFATDESRSKKKDTSAWVVDLSEVSFNNIRVNYLDKYGGMEFRARIPFLEGEIELLKNNSGIEILEADLKSVVASLSMYEPAGESEGEKNPFDVRIKSADIQNSRFRLNDSVSGIFALIRTGEISSDFSDFSIVRKKIFADGVSFKGTEVELNFFDAVKKNNSDQDTTSSAGWVIRAGRVLQTGNDIAVSIDTLIVFHGESISSSMKNFYNQGNIVKAEIDSMNFTWPGKTEIENIAGNFSLGPDAAFFRDFVLDTRGSYAAGNIEMEYRSFSELADASTQFRGSFLPGYVLPGEINTFAPDSFLAAHHSERIFFKGKAEGTLASLGLSNFQAGTEKSVITLNGSVNSLTQPDSLNFNFTGFNAKVYSSDLKKFVPGVKVNLPAVLVVNGPVKGNTSYVSGKVYLTSAEGNIRTDFAADFKNHGYSGNINAENLNAGYFSGVKDLGRSSFAADFDLSGNSGKTLTGNASGNIHLAQFKGFDYRNIPFRITADSGTFSVSASGNQQEFAFNLDADITLPDPDPQYKVNLLVKNAALHKLNFSKAEFWIKAGVIADISGSNVDNLRGNIGVKNLVAIKNDKKYTVDSLVFASLNTDNSTDMRITSAAAGASLKGQIRVTALVPAVLYHIDQYYRIGNLPEEKPVKEQDFTIAVEVNSPQIFTELFFPSLRVKPFSISGAFDSGNGMFSLDGNIPYLSYAGITAEDLSIKVSSDEESISGEMIFNDIYSSNYQAGKGVITAAAASDTMALTVSLQEENFQKLGFTGVVSSMPVGVRFSMSPPALVLTGEQWDLPETHYIHFKNKKVIFHDFILSKSDQQLSVQSQESDRGVITDIKMKDLLLADLSRFISRDTIILAGEADGNITLYSGEKSTSFRSDLEVRELVFKGDSIGDVKLESSVEKGKTIFTADISGHGNNFSVAGTLDKNISIAAKMTSVDLSRFRNLASPFVKDLSGIAQGELTIKGTKEDPVPDGKLTVTNATFRPVIINSLLSIRNETLTFDNGTMRLKDVTVHDSLGNTADLDGSVVLNNNPVLDLRFRTRKFQLLNTQYSRGTMYYGQLVTDASGTLKGTVKAPEINVNAAILEGSSLTFVPLDKSQSLNPFEGIVVFEDSIYDLPVVYSKDSVKAPAGLVLNSFISVDEKAVIRILVDPETGDSLVLRGKAKVNLDVGKGGQVSLTGNYQVSGGSYRLSFSDFIKKDFKIREGSTISWTGDPLDADIDITAVYVANVSASGLMQDLSTVSSEQRTMYRQSLPFQVNLKMTGKLMKPDLDFDIDLPPEKRGALGGTVYNTLLLINENEGEVNRQVFGLLVLNRFLGPEQEVEGNVVASTARTSVSKILTQQLNRLTDKYVKAIDITLGVESYEDYSTGSVRGRTDLLVGLSKSFYNERLNVSVGGNIDIEGQKYEQPGSASNIAGDASIEYLVTEDGRYRLRAMRKTEYEDVFEGQIIETGLALTYVRNYWKWRELFRKPDNPSRDKR